VGRAAPQANPKDSPARSAARWAAQRRKRIRRIRQLVFRQIGHQGLRQPFGDQRVAGIIGVDVVVWEQ